MILASAAGLMLRLYFVRRHAHVEGDSLIYGDLATNMLQTPHLRVTEAARIRPTLIRLPGYPLFLAACFAVFGVANYVECALGSDGARSASACLLTWPTADAAERVPWKARGDLSVWLAALCPFTANYVAAPFTESLAVGCAAVAFYSLERWERSGQAWRWIWPLGIVLSFAVLLRPDRALLAAAVIPAVAWIVWRTRRPRGNRARAAFSLVADPDVAAISLGNPELANFSRFSAART